MITVNTQIQKLLKDSGLYEDAIDGVMGKNTIAAIDTMLSLKGIDTKKWPKARKLIAAEQTLYQSEDIEIGDIDGLEGPMTQYARDVYRSKLTTTWRDKADEVAQYKEQDKSAPASFFDKIFASLLSMGRKKKLTNPEVIAFLGAAQNCLETGYGKYMVGNNAFGIKGRGPAGSIDAWTTEVINGETVKVKQAFRAYNNLDESANDYLDLLISNIRYAPLFAAKTVEEAIAIQGKSGYATSPDYGKSLLAIYKKYSYLAQERLNAEKPQAEPTSAPVVTTTMLAAPVPTPIWPTQRNVPSFFGNVGTHQTKCQVPFPLRIAWDTKKTLTEYSCHEKVKANMERIWARTLDFYGHEKIKELGIDLFGGCLNVRRMRGGSSWSMHSWGIAIDIDPDRNPLHCSWKDSQMSKPAYKQFVQFWYEDGAINLGKEANYDSQHFQFARLR